MTDEQSESHARKNSARRNDTPATIKRQNRLESASSQNLSRSSRFRFRKSGTYFDYDKNTSEATMLAGNPELIDRYNLVRLAARYPVVTIMRAINSAHIAEHPQGVVTLAALQKRLTRAIDRIARDTKRPKTEVQREFQAKRRENGLQTGSKLMSDISEGAALNLLHQAAMGLQQNDGSAEVDKTYDKHGFVDSNDNAAHEMEWKHEKKGETTPSGQRSPEAIECINFAKPTTPFLRARTTTPPSSYPVALQQSQGLRRTSAIETSAIITPRQRETLAALRRPSTGTWRDLPPISSNRATYTLPPLITTTLVNATTSPDFSSPSLPFSSAPSSFSSNFYSTRSFTSNSTTSSATTNSISNSFSSSLMSSSMNKGFDTALTSLFAPTVNVNPFLDDPVHYPNGINNQMLSNIRGNNDHPGHTNSFGSFDYAMRPSKDTAHSRL
jgi:hypothetical protein